MKLMISSRGSIPHLSAIPAASYTVVKLSIVETIISQAHSCTRVLFVWSWRDSEPTVSADSMCSWLSATSCNSEFAGYVFVVFMVVFTVYSEAVSSIEWFKALRYDLSDVVLCTLGAWLLGSNYRSWPLTAVLLSWLWFNSTLPFSKSIPLSSANASGDRSGADPAVPTKGSAY